MASRFVGRFTFEISLLNFLSSQYGLIIYLWSEHIYDQGVDWAVYHIRV